MPAESTYDYAIVRVVPRVERGELINVGVILSCPDLSYLEAGIELDEARLLALDATLDVEAIRGQSRHDSDHLPRWRCGRSDWRLATTRPLPLAGVAPEHDHPDVARPHRTHKRPGCGARAPTRYDGQAPAAFNHSLHLIV